MFVAGFFLAMFLFAEREV